MLSPRKLYLNECSDEVWSWLKVQFQKGISIHQFIEKYGTETQCHNSLLGMRWLMGYRCPNCGHCKCCKLKS